MKFKKMNEDELLIVLERLVRFKNPSKKYKRVFFDILTKFLIEPKLSLGKLETLEAHEISNLVLKIFNSSLPENQEGCELQKIIFEEDASAFRVDDYTLSLMKTPLNITGAIKKIQYRQDFPLRIKRFCDYLETGDIETLKSTFTKKVLLCEGITEEVLLSEFARVIGMDFSKNGIFILGAGGKNQVARKFYELYEVLKIPIFILLDNDAQKIANSISPKLRKNDMIYIIKEGEFEDILPVKLIKKALNRHFKDGFSVDEKELQKDEKMTQILHDLFKLKAWGEFKKAEFAAIVKKSIADESDLSAQIREILELLT